MRQWLVCLLGLVACGVEPMLVESPPPATAGIVGGAAYAGEPAIGALFVDELPYCTGTLITRRKVLTAAHCLVGVAASRMEFRLGPNAFSPSHTSAVKTVRPHHDYDPESLANDIGYVTLRGNAPVTPLPLVRIDDDWVGAELRFVGYGVTSAKRQRGGGRKRTVWMPIVAVENTAFQFDGSGQSTCFGDSGGPALFYDDAGSAAIAGVTSWGEADCSGYGGDTRVDGYLGFLGVGAITAR